AFLAYKIAASRLSKTLPGSRDVEGMFDDNIAHFGSLMRCKFKALVHCKMLLVGQGSFFRSNCPPLFSRLSVRCSAANRCTSMHLSLLQLLGRCAVFA